MRTLTDALGRLVSVPAVPQRMISLCPSVTETLYVLGAGNRVVGRTRFCIHPMPAVRDALRVGGTKEIDFERVASLQPDLIWCVKEENTAEMVAELEKHWPVYVFDIQTVADGYAMIQTLGEVVGCDPVPLVGEAKQAIEKAVARNTASHKVLYLIWRKPWFAVGSNTYIHDLLQALGWHNVAADLPARYPELTDNQLINMKPDVILLSSEPYPFKEKDIIDIQKLLPETKVVRCDGEAFSWYGARMRKLPAAVQQLDVSNNYL